MSSEEVFFESSPGENPVKSKSAQVDCLEALVIDHLHQAPRNRWRHLSPKASEATGHPDVSLDGMPPNDWRPIIVIDIVINRLAGFQCGMLEAIESGLKKW